MRYGLNAAALEDEGRLLFSAEKDPLQEREAALRRIVEEEEENGRREVWVQLRLGREGRPGGRAAAAGPVEGVGQRAAPRRQNGPARTDGGRLADGDTAPDPGPALGDGLALGLRPGLEPRDAGGPGLRKPGRPRTSQHLSGGGRDLSIESSEGLGSDFHGSRRQGHPALVGRPRTWRPPASGGRKGSSPFWRT